MDQITLNRPFVQGTVQRRQVASEHNTVVCPKFMYAWMSSGTWSVDIWRYWASVELKEHAIAMLKYSLVVHALYLT